MSTALAQAAVSARGRWALLALVGLFALPAAAAWVLYAFFPDAARSLGTTNHGHFVHPARAVALPALQDPDGTAIDPQFLRGKWTYVYFDTAACDEVCRENLWKMRQVRLAQGEEARRVQGVLVLTDTRALTRLQAFLQAYPGLTVAAGPGDAARALARQFAVGGGQPAAGARRIYIVDPAGRLMMYYGPQADPKGMIDDMQRLLKVSRIG
ncbi:MAG: hypothetical protein GWO16_04865 [Gammaproteobacteria bacterium]|nr:hypothetical protein [Gammaproteobacteria bacterium]